MIYNDYYCIIMNDIILDILLDDVIEPIKVSDISGSEGEAEGDVSGCGDISGGEGESNEIRQVLIEIIDEIVDNDNIKIEKENHRSNFQCALGALKKYQPFALKKSENNPYNDIPGGYGKNIQPIENFYSEGFKIYTWQKKWKGDIFIYGNPFPSYSF